MHTAKNICDNHLTCKAATKCLNICERVEVREWNKRWSPLFPCRLVSRQCLRKKTLIEYIYIYIYISYIFKKENFNMKNTETAYHSFKQFRYLLLHIGGKWRFNGSISSFFHGPE